ncbi:Aliphatic amidase AmiE [hydrothermal vent metagenome]|uniref:Aliphatic amidase AmiE n=1 Tax=hydrothermal vent metagenome TaxID=652676 RepID=A0A3B0R798_9ZZZZ
MAKFAIAGLQLELKSEDNVALICDEIRTVRKRFAWLDMIVLAELAAFGTGLKHAQSMPGVAEQTFCALAKETGLWILPGSLYEKKAGKIYNTAPVINPDGEVITRCRKMFPFLPYEVGVASGEELTVFDVPAVGRFGVSICYDMWFPETTRSLVSMGAEVILHPSLTNTLDRDAELAIARASATTNQCYFFDINSAGPLAFGRSIIAGPGGEIIHQAGSGREIMPIEIDMDYVRHVRERGWHNLGQPLKSFRDHKTGFPAYRENENSPMLQALGPLVVTNKTSEET